MSYLLKLERAEEHLELLEQDVERWKESKPYDFVTEIDDQAHQGVVKLKVLRPVPIQWSLQAGDVLFNLRSALDHIAFELATRYKGSPLSDKKAKRCAFPIFGRSPSVVEVRDKFGIFEPRARAIIDSVQPYRTSDYSDDPLYVIHTLNNIDKHRILHTVLAHSFSSNASVSGDYRINTVSRHIGPLCDGVELYRFTITKLGPGPGTNMDFGVAIEECFQDIPSGRMIPFVHILRASHSWVKDKVIDPLTPFLS